MMANLIDATNAWNATTLTLGEIAKATGLSGGMLRGWIDRKQVFLDADENREQQGWRRFSALDAVRLTLIGRMVKYGVPVARASEILEGHFNEIFQNWKDCIENGTMKPLTLQTIVGRLNSQTIFFGEFEEAVGVGLEAKWRILRSDEINPIFPGTYVTLRVDLEVEDVIANLNVRRLKDLVGL